LLENMHFNSYMWRKFNLCQVGVPRGS